MIDADSPADVPTTGQSSPGRRWWMSWVIWLSLLAVSLLVIASVLFYPAYRRLRAFQYLDANGINYKLSDHNEWMTDWFGDHTKGFRDVTAINVQQTDRESDLLHVAEFREVETLVWFRHRGQVIGKQGIEALQQLSNLQILQLYMVRLDDDVLARWLSDPPPRLRHIELEHSGASHDVLMALANVRSVEQLQFWSTRVIDEAFIDLPPMERLLGIAVARTGAGDHAAAWLSQCLRLEDVDLSETSITDDGLREISQLPELRVLSLSHCPHITDAGVMCLGDLTRLEFLSLPAHAVSAASVESLSRISTLSEVLVTGTIDDAMLRQRMSDLWDYREVQEGSP